MVEASALANDIGGACPRPMSVVAASEAQVPLDHLCGALVDGEVGEVVAFGDMVPRVAQGALFRRLVRGWGCSLANAGGVGVGGALALLVRIFWRLLRSRLCGVDLCMV